MRRALWVIAVAVAAACGGSRAQVASETQPVVWPDAAPPDAAALVCSTGADCPSGTFCTGGEGCDIPWTCQPLRPCTRDAVEYCACDGTRIVGSSTCPPRPYAHKGACR
jgi:hypothetical protein